MKKGLFALIHNKINYIKYFKVFPVLLLLLLFSSGLKAQNNAIAFDGTGDIISIPNSTNWEFGTGDFTISFWVSFANLNKVHDGLFGRNDYQWIAMEYNHDSDHRLNLWIDDNGSGWSFNNLKPAKNNWIVNTWYHIAVVRSNNQIMIFIDGELDGTGTYTNTVYNPTVPLYFGRSQLSNRNHQGMLDEIRIYNFGLSQSEINAEMFNELLGNEPGLLGYWNMNEQFGTTVHDLSPAGIDGTLINDAVIVSSTSPVQPYSSLTAAFSPVDPTGLPYSFIITDVTIDGGSLPLGTSIGIYDDTLCVGASLYDSQNNTQVITWEKDVSQSLAGFTNGNTAIFKVRLPWFSQIQIFTATPTFTQGNGNFGYGTFSVVSLNITSGLTPEVTLSDTLFNFNALSVNNSISDTLIITNNGNAILNVSNISTSNSVFSVSSNSFQIDAGSSDTLVITFTPTQVLAYTEVLTLITDHPSNPSIEVSLHGSGLPTPTSNIIVNPQLLNFGGVAVSDTATLSFYILNGGNGNLVISNITSSNSLFTINGSTSFTLGQNMNEEVFLSFMPTTEGLYSGNVQITSNEGNFSLPFTGIGTSGYFTSVPPTGLPYSIIIESAEVQNFNALNGEIAVYDDTLCVGVGNFLNNGNSILFDGNDYIQIPDNPIWDFGTGDFTISMWAKHSYVSSYNTFIEIGNWTNSIIVRQDNPSTIYVYYMGSSYSFPAPATLGQWFYLTARRQSGQLQLFINGNQVGTTYSAAQNIQISNVVRLGSSVHSGNQKLYGNLDEVSIWNYARSVTDIQFEMGNALTGNEPGLKAFWNFNDGLAIDLSGNGNHGTFYGDPTVVAESPLQSSVQITAWQADASLGLAGFTPGDTMDFKILTNIYNTDVEVDAVPTYVLGDGTFGYNPYTVVNLSGSAGLSPIASISSTNIYIGQVQISQSITDTLTVYNTGNADLNVNLEELSLAFSLSAYSAIIPASDSLEIILTFSPTTAGNYSSPLTISTNDPLNSIFNVALEGFALPSPQTDINLSLNNLNYNGVITGNAKSLFFNVINNGTAPLVVSNITSNNGMYVAGPTSFTLQNTNDNQQIEVVFTPTSKGVHTGTLTVQSNAPVATLNVTGIGIDGHFSSVAPTGSPYNIIIDTHNLAGYLAPGDEIAVFDNGVCVGVSAIQSDTGNIQVTAWEEDTQNSLAGFTPGDSIEIKLWTAINGFDNELGSDLTFIIGDGTYGFGILSLCNAMFTLPQIIIDPTSLFVALDEPDSTIVNLTVTNPGNDSLFFEFIPPQSNFTASYYSSPGSGSSPPIGNFAFSIEDDLIYESWGSSPGPGVGTDDFQVIWTGIIYAEVAGVYNFRSYSDDGIRLYIDGQTVIDYWYDQGGTSRYGSMTLTVGVHDLEFRYYENGGGQVCHLYWTPPGEAESLIQAADFGDWITFLQPGDTLAPGQSSSSQIEFNSTGLIDGLYESFIYLNTNTTTNSQVEVPVSMNVTGFPQIQTSVEELDFGELIVGETNTLAYTITNIGTDSLIIDSMYMSVVNDYSFLTAFSLPIELAPLESSWFEIGFTPLIDGLILDSIYILSNASNNDTSIVTLTGNGLTPADIDLSSYSWTGSIASGDVLIDTFYIYNYGQANLLFTLNNTIPWLSLNPASGTIGVLDSIPIQINVSGIGVYAGEYSGIFDIGSNDLIDPVLQFSLSLSVSGEPEISAPSSYDFGVVNVGQAGQFDYIITNSGSDTLTIDSILMSDPVFSFGGAGSFIILPGETDTLPLIFIPQQAFTYSGIMTIYSDAVTSPVFPVAIHGTGYEPPEISLPDSIIFTTSDMLSGIENLLVSNTGGDDLTFSFIQSNPGDKALSLDGNGDYINIINSPELNPDTALTIEAWIYPTDNTQEFIVAKEYSSVGNYRLFINSSGKLQFQLNNSKTLESSTIIPLNSWSHIAASTNGKILQIFIDGVLDSETEYAPFTISSNTNNIRIGRSHLNEYFDGKIDELRIWGTYLNDTEIQTIMVQHLNGDEPGLLLYLPFNNESGNIVIDHSLFNNNGTMYGNSTRVSSDIPIDNFFSISPFVGLITQGNNESVAFNFNPAGFKANNNYDRPLYVQSNDPNNPLDTISVVMEVSGSQDLTVSSSSILFSDTYIGVRDTIQILVTNPGQSVINVLDWVIVDSDFSLEFEYALVMPFSSKYVNIYFTPTSGGLHQDTLRIHNDSGSLVLEVEMLATGLVPPVISLNQMNLTETLDWGLNSSQSIIISNNGDGPLNFDLTGIPAQWLGVNPSSGTVSSQSTVEVFFSFNATNDGGDYLAQVLVSSNDLTNPEITIPVSLHINGAILSVTPPSFSKYVTYQDTEADTMLVFNTGVGPLTYTVTEGANWLTATPQLSAVPPGGHDTVFIAYDGNFPHGNYQENLIINCNDPVTPQFAVPVNMDILHATLVTLPTSLNFGYSVVNVGETMNLTVFNNGNVPLTILNISSVAPYTPIFTGPIPLAPGATILVPVEFMPNATLIFNELITITTDIGNFTTPVTGTGQNPFAAWDYSWDEWDFGLVDNAVGAVKNLIIYNLGNIPFTMDDFSNSNPSYFDVSQQIFTILPGQTHTVQVYFNPNAVEIYEGTFNWTVNAIGTKEILVDGRGFFLSQAPMLTYVNSPVYNGTDGVTPLIGSSTQVFEYKVVYTDADNNPPLAGYPIVGLDRNGDGDYLDSGEDEFTMYEVDGQDDTYTDGKEYVYSTTLPLNMNLGYSFYAYDNLGNIPIGEGVAYRSDPYVSDDFLDLSIFANDITFSDLTPAVGQNITIWATVHNNSDYPAENISVKFYEEDTYITELFIAYIGPQSQGTVSINHVFPIDEFYPMKVVVDEQNYILEDNELNNFAIRPVVVGEFSIPGAIVATAHISPGTISPYGTLHYWGHADYVNSWDPNANVSGAQVQFTVVETGATYTTYTNSNGDFSFYFTGPAAVGSYTVVGTVTDFTLLATLPITGFNVFVPSDPIIGPDLAITYWWGTDIHWTNECRKAGEPIQVTAIVTNIGNAPANDVLVHVFQDGNLILTPSFASIPAGTNVSIQFTVTYATVGTHSVSVDIDPFDMIVELSEWNNYGAKSRWIYPPDPDLKPTGIWFSDNTPLQGQPINTTLRISNIECETSAPTFADIFHIFNGVTTLIATLPVDPINGLSYDQLYLYNQTYTEVGWHSIKIVVDPLNIVTETNEQNNVLIADFYVEQAIADLTISDISFSAYNPDIGDLINFTATIWNNGTADADDFYVRFYIDGTQIGTPIHINLLPHGVNMLVTSAPWQVLDCGHTVTATVDEIEDNVLETNPYNNSTNRPVGTDFVPGLWPYYWSSSISVLVGTPVNLMSRIYNNGTFDADTVYVSYLVNNVLLAYDGIPHIDHGHYQGSNVIHTFTNTGDYDVLIYADMLWPGQTRFCELDETNNTVVLHVHVYGENPDLEVLSQHISPTELNPDPGELIDIFGSFTNEGNVPSSDFYVKFFANSIQLGDSVYVPGLGAHEDTTVECTSQFSSNLIGTHILRLEVDVFNDVTEVDELNNMASRAIIVGDAPDHTFSDYGAGIWLSDTFPTLGQTIVINGIIENNGGATGTADLSYYHEYLGNKVLIQTIPFTAAPYDSIDIPINWVVTVPYGKIIAEITNASPEEFNTLNNDTEINFGNELDPLIAIIDPSALLICLGESVTLSGAADGGFEQFIYSWSSDPVGFTSTDQSVTVFPEVNTTYTLTVDDGFSTATAVVTITVIDLNVNLGPDQVICGNGSLVLDAGVYDTYLWSTGETTQTITATDNGTYYVDVELVNFGCTDSDTIQISMSSGPNSETASYVVCEPLTVTHMPQRGSGFTYEWSDGTTLTNLVLTLSGTYYATVTDLLGCITNDTITFLIDTFTVDLGPDQTLCLGQSVTLDAGQGNYNYLWSTNDVTQTLTVNQGGTFSVMVSNSNQCANGDTIVIEFVSSLNVDLGGPVYLCSNGTATLDAGIYSSYNWSTGETTQVITITDNGLYHVTVADQNGCTGVGEVQVNMVTVIDVDIPDQYICDDVFSVSTNEGQSWLWSTGETTNSIIISDEGIYSIIVSYGFGCTDLDTFTVYNAALPVDLGPDIAFCEGDNMTLTVPNNYTNFAWSTGETTSTITLTDGGMYYLSITNPNYNCVSVDSIYVTLNTLPEIIWNSQINICENQPATLNPGIFTSYLWNDQSTNNTLVVLSTGTYSVTVIDQNQCSDSSSVTVNQFANPVIDLGPDTTICEGEIVPLDAGFYSSYIWSTSETTSSIYTNTAGNFSATVTDQNGCSGSDDINITVLPISVDLGPDTFICPGTSLILDPGQYTSYYWSDQSTNQTFLVNQAGTYSVMVEGANGCFDEDEVVVIEVPGPALSLGPDQSLCDGNETTLFAGYFGSYQWSNGATTQTLTVATQGTYSVTVVDYLGCIADDNVDITVFPLPTVSIIGLNAQYCDNDGIIVLTGDPAGGNFTGTGVLQSQFYPANVNPGQIEISYSYSDNNGCSNSTSATTTVFAAPNVSFSGLDVEYFSNDPADPLTGSPTGGIFSGTGVLGNSFDPVTAGVGPHDVTYSYTDNNGCSDSETQSTYVTTVYNISGTVQYAGGQTPINPVDVYLEDSGHNNIDTAQNDLQGYYIFNQKINGTYYLSASSTSTTNGINATDALNIRRHVVYLQTLDGLPLDAADVNASGNISSADALLVLRKTVGYISTFPAGDWVFNHPQLVVNNADVVQDLYGMCFGDVNGSYLSSPTKSVHPTAFIEKSGSVEVEENDEIIVPVSLKYANELGAMTFIMQYPSTNYEVLEIESDIPDLIYRIDGNEIRIAFENTDGLTFNAGGQLFSMRIRILNNSNQIDFNLNAETEFADKLGRVLENVIITMPDLGINLNNNEFNLGVNYPNPFKTTTSIKFNIPEDSYVKLSVQDIIGQEISILINKNMTAGEYTEEFNASNLSAGVYIYKIEVKGTNDSFTSSRIMQIIK